MKLAGHDFIVYAALQILHSNDWILRFFDEIAGGLAETAQEIDLDILWHFGIK